MARYKILKKMLDRHGNEMYVLLNDGYGEILEFEDPAKCESLVKIMNSNTDSGWSYQMVKIEK